MTFQKLSALLRTLLMLVLAGASSQTIRAQVVNADVRVKAFTQIAAHGNRPAWSSQNLIAYDAPNPSNSNYFDMYTMQPDGTDVKCLTCGGAAPLPAFNKGSPDWSPDAKYIVFQAQTATFAPGSTGYANATPGLGVGNDIFIMDVAANQFYQITQNAPGVLHARFSHDGTKIIWVQRVGGATGGNDWTLMLGQFAVANGTPQVTNIQSLPPCNNGVFCETGDFSLDDSTIFFTGVLSGQPFTGLDIYSYVLSTGVLTNLTNSPSQWDELPRVLPNQNKLVWMSGTGDAAERALKTDYWIMDYDGTNKVQLTYHNDTRATVFWPISGGASGVTAAKSTWSPDATSLAAQITPIGVSALVGGSIYVENFEQASASLSGASYARPPIGITSIVSTFYSNLASAVDTASGSQLPMNLGGTSATLTDATGAVLNVPLFFVSPGQVNWLVPTATAPGPATLQITNPQQATVRDTIDIEEVGPGLFAASSTGAGAALGYFLTYAPGAGSPSSSQLLFSCPAGQTCQPNPVKMGGSGTTNFLVLFGTGIRNFEDPVMTQVGNQSLPAAFSGAQGTYFGVDQVNVLVPLAFAGTGAQAVNVTVDGLTSNSVEIAFQ